MIVFIYAFAWVFVLSSAIPSIILGKERSVLVQFFVCLTLTFVAFLILDTITTHGGGPIHQLLNLATLFENPFLAIIYLSIPYLLMIILDISSNKKHKKERALEKAAAVYMQDALIAEQKCPRTRE